VGEPLAVGLVGAGTWAEMVHAPVLADGPETTLAGVWARRPDAARALAGKFGAPAFERLDELFDHCDAVAFAVAPAAQAELAPRAARAGKALLLEKPLAEDLDGARRLVDVVEETGTVTQVMLSWRFTPAVREFLGSVPALGPIAASGRFVCGAMLGGPFVSPWRLEHGALLDVGPHLIDLLAAALGPVVAVRAHGERARWVGLLLDHEGGAVSEASMSLVAATPDVAGVEVYGDEGSAAIDLSSVVGADTFATARREFVDAVRSKDPPPLDARHALRLQEIIARAVDQLG
jgi:predicted dehydrogenase